MGHLPDLRFLFILAMFGILCAALLAIGVGWYAVAWIIDHVRLIGF
jgi:hypothetical protein